MRANTGASGFTDISTILAHPFVRRAKRFNLPRSIVRCPSFQFTAPYFPITCHMLVDRQCPIYSVSVSLVALRSRQPLQQPHECRFVPTTHLKVHPPTAIAALPPPPSIPTLYCVFFAPTTHICPHSSNTIVDTGIIAALPLARLALIARIRSRAIAPFFHPTAY